ncbi:hypothetical protein GCM10022270_18620 [Terriglobus aquaticus]
MPYAAILAAALLAILPLLLHGPSCGHDLPFHLLNWMDAAHQWRAGVLRPWWCAAAAWNAGEARFLFYPPLSWTLGGLLTAAFGAARAPLAYTFVALALCGVTMRRFLSEFVSAPLALVGGCLYLAHPYLLFTATERTAYAELLASAWLPWMLRELFRERISAARLALPVALLWLTNTPSSVLATYTLAVVLGVRAAVALRRGQPLLRPLLLPAVAGYLWGVALSAIFLLPALVQHSAVEVGQAFSSGMRPEDGTLFTHTGEPLHDQVVHQASILAVLLVGAAALAGLLWLAQRGRTERLHGMRDLTLQRSAGKGIVQPAFLLLTVLVTFLLTPASLLLWHHLPELHFLQFPWRILMLQGVLTVASIVSAIRVRLRYRVAIPVALLAVFALSFAAHHSYAQACDDEDLPTSLQAQYTSGSGFEPYDEYTPRDADNDLLHPGEPAAWTAEESSAPPPPVAQAHAHAVGTGSPGILTIQAEPRPGDHFLIVRQRAFRNWHVILDGVPVPQTVDRDDDLLAVPITGGVPHTLTLRYEWSPDQVAGVVISLLATGGFVVIRRPARRQLEAP